MPVEASGVDKARALTANIVSAYASKNKLRADDLVRLIQQVFGALDRASRRQLAPTASQAPAVPIKRSVTRHYIVCLEDGRKLKTLKGHLRRAFGMTPEQYREKWQLPADYPMVAPSYSKRRSALAKELGLGKRRGPARSQKSRGRNSSRANTRA